ncbi:hypothetical protein [Arthrobacter sp. M4]|uniref:hypothetical protein n=1 Tax=Arthrobacter sp. M4 TaxID=218160 RepID=UPI001CDC3D0D|nr:hypothetical protein [Arthrobacter sp. M4]MCA4135074.1 hypothetical protein [Arthrobacter sp. M4]
MGWMRRQMFNIIAGVFLTFFVAVWATVLIRVGSWIPTVDLIAPPLNGALVTAAGVLATSLSSLTASALGFTISEVRREQEGSPPPVPPAPPGRPDHLAPPAPPSRPGQPRGSVNPVDVMMRLSGRVVVAIVVYLTVGTIVLIMWLFKGQASTDLVGAFALSILGWLVGAAGAVFQTENTDR